MRNALHSSRKGGKQAFFYPLHPGDQTDGTISREAMRDALEREIARSCKGDARQSRIDARAILIDNYSKMTVAFAKQIFDVKSIIEHLIYCMDVLTQQSGRDVFAELDTHMKSKHNTSSDATVEEWLREVRVHPTLGLSELRYQVNWIIENFKSEWPPGVGCSLRTLEYQAVVGELFNKILLNGRIHITKENIDRVQNAMNECLEVIADWHGYKTVLKRQKNTNYLHVFLSPQTWANLR